MKREHCDSLGSNRKFETANYHIWTTPKSEWTLVVDGDLSKADMSHGRQFRSIGDLMNLDVVTNSKPPVQITRDEVTAVVLYTGPMVSRRNLIPVSKPD